jgi:hypothetical protein
MPKALTAAFVLTLIVVAVSLLPPYGPFSLAAVFIACDQWPRFCYAINGPQGALFVAALWAPVLFAIIWLIRRVAR